MLDAAGGQLLVEKRALQLIPQITAGEAGP